MGKVEKYFQSELRESVKHICPEAFLYKIPDMPRFRNSRFIPSKPFDFFFAWQGKVIAIETKAHVKHTAWSLSDVKNHQIQALYDCKLNGMSAYIIINVRFGRGKDRVNFAVIMDINMFSEYITKQKSIKVEELIKMRKMKWFKHGDIYCWDLVSLL